MRHLVLTLFVLAALVSCERPSQQDDPDPTSSAQGSQEETGAATSEDPPPTEGDSPFDEATEMRDKMVTRQLEARGIEDPAVLRAMRRVPRHAFVPGPLSSSAYRDGPLPIGEGQTISQPYIVAFMTELLEPQPDDRVLDVGTGSGYQAAVLGEIVDEVYGIEIVEPLARRAKKTLAELGYENITVRAGDGYKGWPDKAPFDGIIVAAAAPKIPQPLLDQLAVGARLVIPVGEGVQELMVIERTKDGYEKKKVLPVRFVPMTGEVREGGSKN